MGKMILLKLCIKIKLKARNAGFDYMPADWSRIKPVTAYVSHTFTLKQPVKGQGQGQGQAWYCNFLRRNISPNFSTKRYTELLKRPAFSTDT